MAWCEFLDGGDSLSVLKDSAAGWHGHDAEVGEVVSRHLHAAATDWTGTLILVTVVGASVILEVLGSPWIRQSYRAPVTEPFPLRAQGIIRVQAERQRQTWPHSRGSAERRLPGRSP